MFIYIQEAQYCLTRHKVHISTRVKPQEKKDHDYIDAQWTGLYLQTVLSSTELDCTD